METPTARIHPSGSEGFDEYFAQEWPRLLAFCRAAFGLSRATAEDVSQEAFLNAYRRWDSIGAPGAYVRKVATRLALKQPWEEPVDDIELAVPDQVHADVTAEGRHLIQQALRQLPGQQRAVFALYLDDYADSDIAEILGLTSATVRSYRRNARRTLTRWYRQAARGGQAVEGGAR